MPEEVSSCSVCILGFRATVYFMVLAASLFVVGGMGLAVQNYPEHHCPLSTDYGKSGGFGSDVPCNYAMFTGVTSIVCSFVFFILTIYNICKRNVEASRFVVVELFVATVMFLIFLGCCISTSIEFKKSCDSIPSNRDCKENLDNGQPSDAFKDLYTRLSMVQDGGWAATVGWAVLTVLLSVRYCGVRRRNNGKYQGMEEDAPQRTASTKSKTKQMEDYSAM